MEKKNWKIAMVALLVFAAPLVAFAAPNSDRIAEEYPTYPYPNYDWPYMLAFKGVAVNGEDTSAAAVIALGDSLGDIKKLHFIIDEEAFTVDVRGIDTDPEKGIMILHTDTGEIVAKMYTVNYQQTVFVSGNYKDWELNMVLVNTINDYDIFYKISKNYPQPIPTEISPTVVIEE